MKKSNILNIILGLAVLALAWRVAVKEDKNTTGAGFHAATTTAPAATDTASDSNPALQNIMTRHSVRQFTDKKLTDDQLTTLVKAGMAAPTAMDKRPWSFQTVTDPELLSMLSEAAPGTKHVAGAAAAIIVCGDSNDFIEGEGRDFWIQDCSAASENILLAAHAMGLGAVWCGIYPQQERVSKVRGDLELEENLIPLCVIAVGYPAQKGSPKDKWNPDKMRKLE